MPLSATVEATYQGYIGYTLSAPLINWPSQVRDSTTGTAQTITTNGTNSVAVWARLVAGRSGYVGNCSRTFLFFDGLDTATGGGTITAATLKIFGSGTATSTDTIIVKGSAWGGSGGTSTLASGDFDSLDHSTAYSAKDLSWSGAYNDFTMNSTAISDMNSNGYLNAVLIEGDYDYDNQSPIAGTSVSAGVIDSVVGVASADIDNIIGV